MCCSRWFSTPEWRRRRGSSPWTMWWTASAKSWCSATPMSLAQWTPGTPGQALNTWDAQKREEKGQRTAADTLDSVARSLPALMRAEKIQDKARKAGFDWAEMGPALDKAEEELGELRQAVEQGANVEEELGDLLFAAVKVGRFAGLDSEQALHRHL